MVNPASSTLTLRSGLVIGDPLGKVTRFCEGEYALYDAVESPRDNTLTVHDILLSVAVNSRLDAKGLSSVHKEKWRVEQHLRLLPATLSLADPSAEIPWDTVVEMFGEFEHIRHAKLAIASKILHKKRPALIPMMDDVIRTYYEQAYPDFGWSPKCGPLSGQMMHHFREDLLAARPQLEELASVLEAKGHRLTLVRLLEMLVWIETEPRGYYR
jgi:hypothetical protein